MTAGGILALDIGSTAVKAGRFDAEGNPIGEVVTVRHRQRSRDDAPGHFRADELLDATVRAVRALDLSGVEVVATSTIWHASLAVTVTGDPVGPGLSWELSVPAGLRDEMAARLRETWSHRDSGAYLHPSYSIVSMPALAARAAHRITDLGSWVVSRLGGFTASWPENIAAGSGLWLQQHRRWNWAALDALGVERRLVAEPWSEPQRATSPLVRGLEGAVFLPPVGDGLCHNLGQHAIDRRVAITVGTSGSVRAVTSGPPFEGPDRGLWRYRCAENTVATGGAITSAGNTFEWVAGLFGALIPWGKLDAATVTRLPRADSSIFGRRGPDYPWDAAGSLAGITPGTTAAHLALAWGLDVWRRVADHLASIQSANGHETELLVEGGAIDADPAAAQVLADVLGAPVSRTAQTQPSLAGAALVGATWQRSGAFDIDATVDSIVGGSFQRPEIVATYDPRDEVTHALRDRWRQADLETL